MPRFKVYLAPMEGLADAPLRRVLCRHGGYDECFSEFIRIAGQRLQARTLLRMVPEAENGFKTADGTPVRVQLLGDSPALLAQSARLAESLGASRFDLNFGCPSRFVHHAGAMLLREPELMREIVLAVRGALADSSALSVKIRLGFADKSELAQIARAAAQPGVGELIVHCRTRRALYRASELDWSALRALEPLALDAVPVANGDIVGRESALECAAQSGCGVLMCGRGAFMTPNLGHVIRAEAEPYGDSAILRVALEVAAALADLGRPEKTVMDRVKQFLGYARRAHPALEAFFRDFCRLGALSAGLGALEAALEEH